jgi:hypothetical protein
MPARRGTPLAAWAATTCVLAPLGCSVPKLTGVGNAVVATQATVAPDCVPLGTVVGKGGGFGGSWISNEDLMSYALTDMRNKAAELGANTVQHGQPQLGISGNNGKSTTTSATVVGTAYQCPDHLASASSPSAAVADSATTPAASRNAPPDGAAGFVFGQSAVQAQKACEGSGHQWSSAGDTATCDGTPVDVGFPAKTSIELCTQAICKIDVTLSVDGAQLQALLGHLEGEYGAVTHVARIPEACVDHVEPCLRDGRAKLHLRWTWPDKHTVEVTGDTPPTAIALQLSYATSAWAEKHKALPTL